MAFRIGRGRGRGGRGRPIANAEIMESIEELQARLDALTSDRNIDDGDVSEPEIEATEEEAVQVTPEMKFFQSVLKSTARTWNQLVSVYQGGLNPEELINWINSMEKFFDYEEMEDEKKVKFVVTNLIGHATLWWDGVQAERRRLEEFYKVSIRAGEAQNTDERVARYMNGLRMDIQDEISLLSPKTVEEAYQIALKAEEKLMRKQSAKGRGNFKGKESQGGSGRSTTPKEGASNSSTQHAPTEGDARGRGSFSRGRGGRGGGRETRCYRCNKLGHRAFECPENAEIKQRNAIVTPAEEEAPVARVTEEVNTPERGESLVLNKVLLKPAKVMTEPPQRKALFRTVCKAQGKCCEMIIDSGNTDNLVST
eukprot:PITA_16200